jgi:hypothetical protein
LLERRYFLPGYEVTLQKRGCWKTAILTDLILVKAVIFKKKGKISIFSTGVDAFPLEPEMTFAQLANRA